MNRMLLHFFTAGLLAAVCSAGPFSTLLSSILVKEGDQVPDVVFKCRIRDELIGGSNPFTWKDVKSSDLFKGKRVIR